MRYGLDLATELTPPIRWRRLINVVTQLDARSHLHLSITGDPWSTTDHLLAHLFDVTVKANWSGEGVSPKPIPRPGREPEGQNVIRGGSMTPEQFAEWRKSGFQKPEEATTDG